MAYPYEISAHDVNLARLDTAKRQGPYAYGGNLFTFIYYDDFFAGATIRAYKSSDAGETWSVVGSSPDAYSTDSDGRALSTCRDGDTVVCCYPDEYGVMGDARLTLCAFDMAAETWGLATTDGPTIAQPSGAYHSSAFSGLGFFSSGIVVRDSGERVIVYDSESEIVDPGGAEAHYRRISLVRWSLGTWSSPVVLFDEVTPVRDYAPGNLCLAADGLIHIFAMSVADGDTTNAHHVSLSAVNSLGTEQVVSTDLETAFNFHVLGDAVAIENAVYVHYRKTNGFLAVAAATSASTPTFTESEVYELQYTPGTLNSMLVSHAGSAFLVFCDRTNLLWSQLVGTWSAATDLGEVIPFTASPFISIESVTANSVSDSAIGLAFFGGEQNVDFPYWYYQFGDGGGGGPLCRYYGM
jgi:hypothetical protein